MNSNPLSKFFRQPSIYIQLPSGGKDWAPGSLNLPDNGELPILPMTAIDEITYRTPDALFNGEAVVSVIQSCIPNIKDAWAIPSIDLDAILVGIRIASYGHSMDIGSKCPACGEEHNFELDLRSLIDNIKSADFESGVKKGELEFYFRPLTYREMTQNSQIQFEQQKTIQMLNQTENLEEKDRTAQLNMMMKRLIEVTVKAMSQSITEIRTHDAIVTDARQIEEFLNNCDRNMFNNIRDHVIKLREDSELKPLRINCPACANSYEQAFTLDMANFFESAS